MWRTLGDVREHLGLFEDAILAYRQRGGLARPDPVVRADLLLRRARARMFLGAYRVALAEATPGVASSLIAPTVTPGRCGRGSIALQALLRQAQQRAAPAAVLAEPGDRGGPVAGDDAALARAYSSRTGRTECSVSTSTALASWRSSSTNGSVTSTVRPGVEQSRRVGYFDGRWDDAVKWYRRALDAYPRAATTSPAA